MEPNQTTPLFLPRPTQSFPSRHGPSPVLRRGLPTVTCTDRPETAVWLSEEEKHLAVERIKSERLATTKVLDKMDTKKLLAGIRNPITASTAFMFLCNNVTVQGLAFFLPTIVGTIYPERSTVSKQLFTVPPYVLGGFFTLVVPLISYKFDRRLIFIILTAPLVMVGYAMFLGTTNAQARYGATFLIAASAFPPGALTNSHVSANVLSDTARSSAIGMNGRPPPLPTAQNPPFLSRVTSPLPEDLIH